MAIPIRILLQTTIPATEDNWKIMRFSLLRAHLRSIKDETGHSLYEVIARNRETNAEGNDAVLSVLDTGDFDELWLFAVDTGDGLSVADCQGITRFRQKGGGILTARDLCTLGGVGDAHFFHTRHQDPDKSRHMRDDQDTRTISWPNYHSGSNGDYQKVTPLEPVHELLHNPQSSSGMIKYFPAHPHEGGVGAPPDDPSARVIAVGKSTVTARSFNLIVAFEEVEDRSGHRLGRALAHASFHHFADYNWDTDAGCPSFVEEPPGHGMKENARALADIQAYVRNAGLWLAKKEAAMKTSR